MTTNELKALILKAAGRGLFSQTEFNEISVSVPFWHVWKMRQALRDELPIAIRFVVKSMSLLQHFTVIGVRNETP